MWDKLDKLKSLDKKQLYMLGVVFLVLAAFSMVYCLFIDDSVYYDNYRLQISATNDALDLSMQTMAPLLGTMLGTPKTGLMNSMLGKAGNVDDKTFDEAKDTANLALNYQNKMLKSARTENQRKYAETLIQQTQELIKYLDTAKGLNPAVRSGDSGKTQELMNAFQTFSSKTQEYQMQLQSIEKQDKDLRKRLKQEAKKAEKEEES